MTFEQLRVFHAVVSTGTFRGASERLHKSQPAISKMVQNLEDELGVKLFTRDSYRPQLTEAGRAFYERAADVLEQTIQLGNFARRLGNQHEPLVHLAINAVCPLPPVLQTLRDIQERFPGTELKFSTEHLAGVIERLYENQVDLVISTQTDMDCRIMEAVPYTTVRIIPVAHADHPLAQGEQVKLLAEVQPHVQVIVADSSRGRLNQSFDVMPGARRWRVTDVAAKKEIILAGLGWGGLPEHVISAELASGQLVPLRIDGFSIRTLRLYLIRRKDRAAGPVAQVIWDALQYSS